MRIIGGKLKGRKLVSFKATHIRPTTDRVKESIFNKVQFKIEGAKILDLFSGTGNLSIECYSRGAQQVTAVESSAKSIAIIKKNKLALEIDETIKIEQQDVFKFIKNSESADYDLILIDPPFTKKISHDVMLALVDRPLTVAGGLIIIESQAKERVDDDYSGYILLDRKSFGDKKVSFFARESS